MTASDERGFTLIELVVCVALLFGGAVVALSLLAPLARASQAGLIRGAATEIARNALERARAAAAYYAPAAVSDPAARATATSNHAWVLAPGATYAAAARVHRAFCGGSSPTTDVPVLVTSVYAAATDRLTVTVAYPPDPCTPQTTTTVTLAATLAPAQYAPQTQLTTTIADPAYQ